jgi:hypothetical protein
VRFAAITHCVASQRVFIVVYFVIDSVRKLSDTPSYCDFGSTRVKLCVGLLLVGSLVGTWQSYEGLSVLMGSPSEAPGSLRNLRYEQVLLSSVYS